MSKIPSIALIPSGYKASKLYSVLPTDGTGDFTTTRASVATRVNENGLIEEVAANVPRLDYSDGGCPSLLLEGTSTNLMTYSEDFSNAVWNKISGGTASIPAITSNYSTSPDGTQNADRVYIDTGAGDSSSDYSILRQKADITSGNDYAFSVWLKSNTGSSQVISLRLNGGAQLTEITVTTSWVKYNVAYSNSTTGNVGFGIDLRGSQSQFADLLIYAAQLEENSYSTSYIKTVGSSQTRTADTASGSGNSTIINSSEGVLYFEGQSFGGTNNGFITLSDGSGTNRVSLRIGYFISTLIYIQMTSSGSPQFEENYNTSGTSFNFNDFNKYALKYKQNDCALFLNGVKVITISNASMPTNLSKLQFANSDGVGFPFLGNAKDLRVYTTALTDAELTNLTTI